MIQGLRATGSAGVFAGPRASGIPQYTIDEAPGESATGDQFSDAAFTTNDLSPFTAQPKGDGPGRAITLTPLQKSK